MWWRRRRQATYQPGTRAYANGAPTPTTVEGSSTVVDRKDNGRVYEKVSWARTEAVALEYCAAGTSAKSLLRQIVEMPYRNLGRDMKSDLRRGRGALIEIPERTPLPELSASPTRLRPLRLPDPALRPLRVPLRRPRTAATPGTPRTSRGPPTR